MKILVTGGAGYIGSIVVEQLIARGEQVVVFDNLYQGHRAAVHPAAAFVQGDLADRTALDALFAEHSPEAIMHFASHTLVGKSMQNPFLYIGDNVTKGLIPAKRSAVRRAPLHPLPLHRQHLRPARGVCPSLETRSALCQAAPTASRNTCWSPPTAPDGPNLRPATSRRSGLCWSQAARPSTASPGWTPQYTRLDAIVESAWSWHLAHPNGYDNS